jgi:lipopolysaccharide assembly protein A
MQIMVIFALVIAALAILFAVQNNTPVQISFLTWKVESPLALVLLIAVAAGALISLLASLPTITRDKLNVRSHRKKVAELESSLSVHKGKLEEAQKQLAGQEAEKGVEKVEDPEAKQVKE